MRSVAAVFAAGLSLSAQSYTPPQPLYEITRTLYYAAAQEGEHMFSKGMLAPYPITVYTLLTSRDTNSYSTRHFDGAANIVYCRVLFNGSASEFVAGDHINFFKGVPLADRQLIVMLHEIGHCFDPVPRRAIHRDIDIVRWEESLADLVVLIAYKSLSTNPEYATRFVEARLDYNGLTPEVLAKVRKVTTWKECIDQALDLRKSLFKLR